MKYTKEIIKQICDELKLGQTRGDACVWVGISYETFTQWMKKTDFSDAVRKAETECLRRCIGIIQKAAVTTWQAAAWWLERKHKAEFSLRSEFTGANGEEIKYIISDVSKEKK